MKSHEGQIGFGLRYCYACMYVCYLSSLPFLVVLVNGFMGFTVLDWLPCLSKGRRVRRNPELCLSTPSSLNTFVSSLLFRFSHAFPFFYWLGAFVYNL